MKWTLIIFISLTFGIGYLVSSSLEEYRLKEEELRNEAKIIRQDKEKMLFEKCNIFPKDGYLKTESGYYFDLFKFIKFIEKEQPDFEKEARENPYRVYYRYFSFRLNEKNECSLITFRKFLFWDEKNKKFKNVKEIVDKNLINQMTNEIYDAISYDKTIKNFNNPLNDVGASFDLMSVKKANELIKTENLTWRMPSIDGQILKGKYVVIPLIKYPTIKVKLKDQEVKQGFINTDRLQPNRTFVFEGIDNFGVDYTLQCNAMIFNLPKNKKFELNQFLNMSVPIKNTRCTASTGSNNDRLYREYGGVSFTPWTDNFNDLKHPLEQTIKFIDQFMTKEKIR